MNELQYAQMFFESENIEEISYEIIQEVLSDKLRQLYELWIIQSKPLTDCAKCLSVSNAAIHNMRQQIHDTLAKNKIIAEKYKAIHGEYPCLQNRAATKRNVCDLDFVFEPYVVSALIRFAKINSQEELIKLIESGEDLKNFRFVGNVVYEEIMEWYSKIK